MIEDTLFIKTFGNSPILKVMMFLLENKIFDYPKSEIAKEVGISRTTLNIFWNNLVEIGIVKKTRTVGKAVMYKINTDSPIVKKMIELNEIVCRTCAERVVKEELNKLRPISIKA
ncbi:MAG: hypothetical protein ISS48_02615 [Candidatus Aenigmarchaeota archaeon]|nr:hypothetical protein [Candidatus Aenigmarchaeota archaeon]